MARNTSVSLGERFTTFIDERSWHLIDQQLATGRYDSIDEIGQEGLQLLEDHRSRLQALRGACIEGERGTPVPLDTETFLAEEHAEWQDRESDRHS